MTLAPDRVEQILRRSAVDTPCPNPRTFVYPAPAPGGRTRRPARATPSVNGFYGDGIVNAFNAVTSHPLAPA